MVWSGRGSLTVVGGAVPAGGESDRVGTDSVMSALATVLVTRLPVDDDATAELSRAPQQFGVGLMLCGVLVASRHD